MGKIGQLGTGTAILGLIVAQVILPATIDLVLTCAIAGLAGWAGFKAGRI